MLIITFCCCSSQKSVSLSFLTQSSAALSPNTREWNHRSAVWSVSFIASTYKLSLLTQVTSSSVGGCVGVGVGGGGDCDVVGRAGASCLL